MQYQTLYNGLQIPLLGLGTARMQGRVCEQAIIDALEAGYSLIDTAQMYHNHSDIAQALKTSGIKREGYCIQSKLSHNMSKKEAAQAIISILKELGLEFIDILLIHEPYTNAPVMWEAMEEAYQKGLIKAIGISNFHAKKYQEFLSTCHIKPMLNQVEAHIFYQQHALLRLLESQQCFMQAWSPFVAGKEGFFTNPILLSLAQSYHKTPAQIALRFLIERGSCAIPKTSKKQRMHENLDIFDFRLSDMDTQKLKALDKNQSLFGWYSE